MSARVGYLGLGSNIGDRAAHLLGAIRLLREHEVRVEAVSDGYETEPVGEISEQPDFLNAVARIRTELEPIELLDLCKAIEVEHGRMLAGPRHGPRPLDIDLLLLGEIELDSERLRLPHREVLNRRFVLAPLLELDPGLALPDGTRLADRLAGLGEGQRVSRLGPLAAAADADPAGPGANGASHSGGKVEGA
jgi:2-amino-4-hydroxy-6-hydroxymethyldihydropteridine diphosphokinase